MPKHFLSIRDLTSDQAVTLLARGREMKRTERRGEVLAGKTVALIFEKHSTRTRVSFEVGVRQLGGQSFLMTPAESQLGRSEPLRDTARVLSRYVDCLVVRTFGQDKLDELVEWGTIPVVNALTDSYHPCQVMADMLTISEFSPELDGLTVAWVGDGNNMAQSWINAAARFPITLKLACPKGYEPDSAILETARNEGAKILLTNDPVEAVTGADYVNTDVFASMGQEEEQAKRMADFAGFMVNETLLAHAAKGVRVLHCLPAHREEEISAESFEKHAETIFQQAENRLHIQKAILEHLFS